VELRAGTLEEPPVGPAELDAALLILVLHHAADPGRILAAVRRTLKPGGRLLVVDMQPHDHLDYREQMGHQWMGFRVRPARLLEKRDSARPVRRSPRIVGGDRHYSRRQRRFVPFTVDR
jgi:ubiquinone/menaquinone biosynthesis C-methylase UbiE